MKRETDTVSIWLEDATSVKSRLDIMEKYKLAGAAYWRLGQETDSIWDINLSVFQIGCFHKLI